MSLLSVLLLLALAIVAYLGWVWVPIYSEAYEVKQTTRGFMNRAVKNPHDDELVEGLSKKLEALHRVRTIDEEGRATDEPAVVVPVEDIHWVRDTDSRPPILRVSFSYERQVTYPWIGKTVTKIFEVRLENDLTVPIWDPY